MNVRLALAGCAMLSILCGSACAQKQNDTGDSRPSDFPLINAGFEEPMVGDEIPGWARMQHAGEASYEMTVDRKSPGKGKQSFRMTQTHPQFFGLLEQRISVTPELAGKTVELSGLVRTRNVKERGWMLTLAAADGTNYFQAIHDSKPVLGTTKWHRMSVSGLIPPGTVYLVVMAHLNDDTNHGVVWLDDVKLNIVDKPPAPDKKP